MRRLQGSLFFKVSVVVMFIVAACVFSLGFSDFIRYVNIGVYDSAKSFDYENAVFSNVVVREGIIPKNDFETLILKNKNEQSSNLEKEFERIIGKHFEHGTNIRFVITDGEGNILYSSYTYGDHRITSYSLYGYSLSLELTDFDTDTSNGVASERIGIVTLFVPDLSENLVYDDIGSFYLEWLTGCENSSRTISEISVSTIVMLFCLMGIMLCSGYDGKEGSAKLRFYDKIPTDIFLCIYLGLVFVLVLIFDSFAYDYEIFERYSVQIGIPVVILISLAVLVFFASFSNRVKTRTFLKNSLCFFLISRIGKMIVKSFGYISKLMKKAFRILADVPIVMRSVVFFVGYSALSFCLIMVAFETSSKFALFLWILFNIAVGCLVAWHFAILVLIKKGGEHLYCGDYDFKIDTSVMYLDYKKFAEYLNSVGKGLNVAVEERMKSERMKSELITNVSHDLKTPLTSIINYVDLLKNEERGSSKAEGYIEVLERQSKRLKKLTEDLIFAAKASSGTERVVLEDINISEFTNQVIAEYSDKFERSGLLAVTAMKISDKTTAKADGRLLWRIIDNIFGNVCKYAQSGTRVYIETGETEKTVIFSVKNISREQLNVSADELMQRFVRGESSRSSEGSGLGLSIARDLAILQNGVFDITVDGDLFKTSVILRKN